MGLEITVFYPFHPLHGCTLQILSKAEKTITVLDPTEQVSDAQTAVGERTENGS